MALSLVWQRSHEPLTKSDVPTISSLSRSTDEDPGRRRPDLDNPSLFAADGGFGPMKVESNDIVEEEGGFGDDFDDFEAGAEADDGFGDFDESVEGPIQEAQKAPPAPDIPFVSTLVLSKYPFLSKHKSFSPGIRHIPVTSFPTTPYVLPTTRPMILNFHLNLTVIHSGYPRFLCATFPYGSSCLSFDPLPYSSTFTLQHDIPTTLSRK